MCTNDKKILFAQSFDGELLQINTKRRALVKNHGKICHIYGDLIITKYAIKSPQKKPLILFKDIINKPSTEDLKLNEKKILTEFILREKIVLGEYFATDQGWGNLKGEVLFYVNDVLLYAQSPIGRPETKNEFQIYFEDAFASEGDQLVNKFKVGGGGGHKISVKNIVFFTIPYLYIPKKSQLKFEMGVVGNKNTWEKWSSLKLSKYSVQDGLPKYEKEYFETPDLKMIKFGNVQSHRPFELIAKVNNMAFDIPYNEVRINVFPW